MKIKICAISDTHGKHRKMTHKIPECDILIHAGDYTNRGEMHQVEDFLSWLGEQKQATYKVFIEGNHDVHADPKFAGETNSHMWFETVLKAHKVNDPDGQIFRLLNDSVDLFGLKIWGSPITPDFFPQHWAFNATRGQKIKEVWDVIPNNTDIVVTHGPVMQKVDYIPWQKLHVGCEMLAQHLAAYPPMAHICGHIHCARGVEETTDTKFVNASICNEAYSPVHEPIVFEIEI